MTAKTNLEKVWAIFAAIGDRDPDQVTEHLSGNFVQHVPSIAAGVEGFKQSIAAATPEQRIRTVVRAFEDGPFVVTQVKAEGTGENLFAVDRFEDGLLVEHWAFAAPGAPPNPSGHTQFDGPAEAAHLEDTAKNKAFVHRYYETFHLAGDHSQNEAFFTGNVMIRHEPGVRDGLREFLRDVEELMRHRTIEEIVLLLGRGDLVFIAAKGTHEGEPCVYIDLYRVEDEKIVEHWGFPQKVPPRAQWQNSNALL